DPVRHPRKPPGVLPDVEERLRRGEHRRDRAVAGAEVGRRPGEPESRGPERDVGVQGRNVAGAVVEAEQEPPQQPGQPGNDGYIARLEQLLDEHATIAAMDPAKLPAIRAQIWTLIQAARLNHDLG